MTPDLTATADLRGAARPAVPGHEALPVSRVQPRHPTRHGARRRHPLRRARPPTTLAPRMLGSPRDPRATRLIRTRPRSPQWRSRARPVARRRRRSGPPRPTAACRGSGPWRDGVGVDWRHVDRGRSPTEPLGATGLDLADHHEGSAPRPRSSSSPSRTTPVAGDDLEPGALVVVGRDGFAVRSQPEMTGHGCSPSTTRGADDRLVQGKAPRGAAGARWHRHRRPRGEISLAFP